MGKRGPAPKPTVLRILHGDRTDRINTAEPVAPTLPIEPPDWLSEDARAVWDRYAPSLIARGVMTYWDVDAFAVVCNALARYRDACMLVDASSVLIGSSGRLEPNPALKIVKDAEDTFLRYAARFGLTPSDRQAIKTEVAPHASRGADLLSS